MEYFYKNLLYKVNRAGEFTLFVGHPSNKTHRTQLTRRLTEFAFDIVMIIWKHFGFKTHLIISNQQAIKVVSCMYLIDQQTKYLGSNERKCCRKCKLGLIFSCSMKSKN
jgi:hypothetical protein